MWRSKARAFLIRCSIHPAPSIQNQVPSKTLTVIRYPPLHFSRWFSQNPRFFSNDSNFNNENDGFGENPSFISQESVNPSGILDENHSFISQESIEGENPDFLSQENGTNDDQISSSVTEEPVVEEIEEIDIEKLESVLSVLQSSLDGSLESNLEKMDLTVNEEFGVRVIQTPLVPGHNLISFFKWASKKQESIATTHIVESLVQAIGSKLRKKEVYSLWDLIKDIGEKQKGVLNTEILNELISLCWKLGKGKAALEVFNKFEEFGCDPNADSYYSTIEALCGRKIFDEAWLVCEKMLNSGKLPDIEKIGKIISCFCKGHRAKDAHLVYLMAKEKNKYPPRSSVNFLINSLCRKGETVKLALELLGDFSGDARKYATKPFSSTVRALCKTKDIDGAKKLLFDMINKGPPPGNAVFNSVIYGLSKAGKMEEALEFVKVMESRGLRPDIYAYTVIINGYTKGGQMEEAFGVLSEAKKKHSKLTSDPYHVLIRGYCQLEEYDKALNLLTEMKESGILPDANDYKNVIQSLCLKALDWETAEKLLEEMKENGLYLTGITRGLIKAVKELHEEEPEAGEESTEA
ncbi:Pentatricopeptide repeat [Macleaya cordata]|uniref:Pentatricopeptide repeat n=1 Tax=Macleaya cordata TaxID=56857 RepID=A0A200QJH1_MACCD|nr:Pentatricopeptide repeat [Macleaya cordata]